MLILIPDAITESWPHPIRLRVPALSILSPHSLAEDRTKDQQPDDHKQLKAADLILDRFEAKNKIILVSIKTPQLELKALKVW